MLQLSLKLESGPETKAAHFNQSLTEAMKESVRRWHKSAGPEHFKRGAGRKYQYKPRTRKYQNRKNRLGKPPLVWSGRAMRQILRTIKPIGSKGVVKGKFVTDVRIRYWWTTKPGHPNKGAEMVKTTPTEVRKLQKVIEKTTVDNLDAVREIKKVG